MYEFIRDLCNSKELFTLLVPVAHVVWDCICITYRRFYVVGAIALSVMFADCKPHWHNTNTNSKTIV